MLCSVLGHFLSLKKADVLTPTSSRSPVSKLEMIVGDTEGYKADVTVWGDEALELCQDGNLKVTCFPMYIDLCLSLLLVILLQLLNQKNAHRYHESMMM